MLELRAISDPRLERRIHERGNLLALVRQLALQLHARHILALGHGLLLLVLRWERHLTSHSEYSKEMMTVETPTLLDHIFIALPMATVIELLHRLGNTVDRSFLAHSPVTTLMSARTESSPRRTQDLYATQNPTTVCRNDLSLGGKYCTSTLLPFGGNYNLNSFIIFHKEPPL
jgi:hypothetical protein